MIFENCKNCPNDLYRKSFLIYMVLEYFTFCYYNVREVYSSVLFIWFGSLVDATL